MTGDSQFIVGIKNGEQLCLLAYAAVTDVPEAAIQAVNSLLPGGIFHCLADLLKNLI